MRDLKLRVCHTLQHRPFLQRVMVWSCFSWHWVGPLSVIVGTMNAAKYRMTLEGCLLQQVVEWYGEHQCIFQQDNAPCHTAASIRAFLAEPPFTVMEWPLLNRHVSHWESMGNNKSRCSRLDSCFKGGGYWSFTRSLSIWQSASIMQSISWINAKTYQSPDSS